MRILLSLMFLLVACGTPSSPAPSPAKNTTAATTPSVTPPPNNKSEPYPMPPVLPLPTEAQMKEHAEWFTCQADTDCEIVDMLGCGYCNAGFELSVNKKFTKEAKTTWGKEGNFACTELGCAEYEPKCQANTCASSNNNGTVRPNPITR